MPINHLLNCGHLQSRGKMDGDGHAWLHRSVCEVDRHSWLEIGEERSSGAYRNAALKVELSDLDASFSVGPLDDRSGSFLPTQNHGAMTPLTPVGSDQNLVEDEPPEGKKRKESVSIACVRRQSVQFRDHSGLLGREISASTTFKDSFEGRSFINKSFTDELQMEIPGVSRVLNGTAKMLSASGMKPEEVQQQEEGGGRAGKASAGKGEGGYHGYRASFRRMLRQLSERAAGSIFPGDRPSARTSSLRPPGLVASRRQSESDARNATVTWPRLSSLGLSCGQSGMDVEKWKESGHILSEYHEVDLAIPRCSSVTITTHFGEEEDIETKMENKANGHLESTIPDRDLGTGGVVLSMSIDTSEDGPSAEDSCSSTSQREPSPVVIEDTEETFFRIFLETVLPFVMAGFGCAFAGIVLDIVQHWKVFVEVGELFILVPSLLGLKGNLEMTQASRLSTQANLGHMDTTSEQLKLIGASLALTQVQSVVVAFMASLVAILLGWVPAQKFDILHGILVCTSSIITASIASLVLGSVMVAVVLVSRKFHVNPDNVATPFGGSLGDLTTIALLSNIAKLLFTVMESHAWVAPVLLCLWLALTPLWWTLANRHLYTRNVLHTGWIPVIGAMAISSVGGLILDMAVEEFDGIAVFQPVVNGVGGNLVAVQASRLTTALHRSSVLGVLPVNAVRCCPNVRTTFFGRGTGSKTARVLMLMVAPGHIIFMFTIEYLKKGCSTITPTFAVIYLAATLIQVATLLYIANFLVHWLWSRGNDPDNYSIPYLTAIGDLLGGLLLAGAFYIVTLLGDVNTESK